MARIRGSSNNSTSNPNNNNTNSYEEARRQRLEENKKKFQDLGIMRLSESLSEVIKPVQKPPKLKLKISKERLNTEDVRRSNRSRGSATPYSEEFKIELARSRPRKKPKERSMTSLARPLDEVKTASNAQRAYTEKCAMKFQSALTSGNPYFIKSMRHSHVYSGFWLGLPSDFCQNYLPEDDATMVLEDPDGVEHDSLYKAMKNGLSAGWRHFALVHKLDDGDALIFELIQPQKFKVYFFRVSELYKNGAKYNSGTKEAKNVKSVA